jgi:hypothetical protein
MNSSNQVLSPNRHLVATFTFAVLLPLVYYIPPWVVSNVTNDHFFVTVFSLVIIVPIISYVALPFFFKALKKLSEK